jgi:hypothetical protein
VDKRNFFRKTAIAMFVVVLGLQSASMIAACSFFPGLKGGVKSSELKCIYLTTDSLVLNYECAEDSIAGITIINHSAAEPDSSSYSITLPQPVVSYRLPVVRSSIVEKSIEIIMDITGSHSMESFTLVIKPGELNKRKKIYSSYSRYY